MNAMNAVMRRALSFFALLLALVFAAGTAHAQGPQLTQGAGATPDAKDIAPIDAPRVTPGIVVPPVPSEYETQNLGWMRISYPREAKERVEPSIAGAGLVKEHLSFRFGQPVLDNVEVRVARSWDEMAKLAPVGAPPPAYASGVAYSSLKLVLVTLTAPRSFEAVNVDETVRHELSHIALADAVGDKHLPRWFQEGVAIRESGEMGISRATDLSQASLWGTLIPLSDLDRFPADGYGVSVAYAESGDFLRFLMRDEDIPRFQSLVTRVREGQKFDSAITDAYGSDLKKLEYQWKEDVSRRYSAWPAFFSVSFLWVLVIGALGWGYVKRRRRSKAIMDRWAKEEAFEDAVAAARRAVIEGAEGGRVAVVALPVIQHEGRTHTLH
jgi:hypothetical protein